jgi:hypothetical protein
MRRFRNHLIGVDQGSTILFSDFEDGGPMWTGKGKREHRVAVTFREPFKTEPAVFVALDMWDCDQKTNLRADVAAEKIGLAGFEIVFRTWADTRIARVRAAWMAIGELRGEDEWELY